jgi:hypothetical protein
VNYGIGIQWWQQYRGVGRHFDIYTIILGLLKGKAVPVVAYNNVVIVQYHTVTSSNVNDGH